VSALHKKAKLICSVVVVVSESVVLYVGHREAAADRRRKLLDRCTADRTNVAYELGIDKLFWLEIALLCPP
jgi:hypothetical protein